MEVILYIIVEYYEVILHCRFFACMSMHHSHVESWCCKGGLFFYFGDNVRRVWNLTYDVFVASWVMTLRWFGTTCIYVSSIGAYHIDMSLNCCNWMMNVDGKCVWWIHDCDIWNCCVNVLMEINYSC